MTTSINALTMRRTLGRKDWATPTQFGPDGWALQRFDESASVLVTCAPHDDGVEWVHASIARPDQMPEYGDLTLLHRAVWRGRGWAYQVFAPDADHVNIHHHALHLWGRLDGAQCLPNFGAAGSI